MNDTDVIELNEVDPSETADAADRDDTPVTEDTAVLIGDRNADQQTRSFEFRATPAPDGTLLEGYAAVFNQRTTIRDQLGEYTEEIMPGAFKRSLGRMKPIIQYNHGKSLASIADMPIAVPQRISEDKTGLYVRAKMIASKDTEHLMKVLQEGAIEGMSFRFEPVRDTWDESGKIPHRQLHEVRLFEVSVTPFPAYRGTSVSLRSLSDELSEDELRELMTIAAERGIVIGESTTGSMTVADEAEPVPADEVDSTRRRVTRQAQRHMALLLSGVTPDEPPRAAAPAAA